MGPHRRRLRLPGHDYGQPASTFVTICLSPRVPLLSVVRVDQVELTALGEIVDQELDRLRNRFEDVDVVPWVVMPDHVHAIVRIRERGVSVSTAVRVFKSFTARRVNVERGTPGRPFWQRGFHDHVIRDEDDMERYLAYIATNPTRWSASRS